MTDLDFEQKVRAYPCRHCKALPGALCLDRRGRPVKRSHSDRKEQFRLAWRLWVMKKETTCPTCGGRGRVRAPGQPDGSRR